MVRLAAPGWRARDSQRAALAVFSLALVLGAIGSALGIWFVGGLIREAAKPFAQVLVALAAIALVAREFRIVRFRLPAIGRQVPQSVFSKRVYVAAFQFGFALGTGLRTRITANSPYLLFVALLLWVSDVESALALGVGFGAGRAFPAISRYLRKEEENWDDTPRLRWMVPASSVASMVGVVGLVLPATA